MLIVNFNKNRKSCLSSIPYQKYLRIHKKQCSKNSKLKLIEEINVQLWSHEFISNKQTHLQEFQLYNIVDKNHNIKFILSNYQINYIHINNCVLMEGSRKEIGGYVLVKTIGSGTFGKVKLAQHKETKQQVAIKILQKERIVDVADVERVTRQIHILKTVRHPNIIQLYEIIETPKYLFLVMEYIENGELFQYIVQKKSISELEAAKVYHQLLDAIQYIHKLGIVHRDLKPENLLLDYKNNLKIVDFGLSNTYILGQKLKTPCGSPCYAAPQMIKGLQYRGLQVDIWSSGIILYTMIYGYLPFQDQQTSQLYRKIRDGNYSLPITVSSQARELLRQIIEVEPSKRLTIPQIRNHPWMIKVSHALPAPAIIFGYSRIPIDKKIVSQMVNLGYSSDSVLKNVEMNRHTNITTVYYLLLKKHIKNGGTSACDLSNPQFDRTLIQHVENNSRKISSALGNIGSFSASKRESSKLGSITERHSVSSKPTKKKFKSRQRQALDSQQHLKKSPLKIGKQRGSPDGLYKINRKYKQKFDASLVSKYDQKEQRSMGVISSMKTTSKSTSKKKKGLLKLRHYSKQLFAQHYSHKNTARSTKQSAYLQKMAQDNLQHQLLTTKHFPSKKKSVI